jgi:hypothetical protein
MLVIHDACFSNIQTLNTHLFQQMQQICSALSQWADPIQKGGKKYFSQLYFNFLWSNGFL